MNNNYHFIDLCRLSRKVPDALALIGGSEKYPSIRGRVRFYQTFSGVIVMSEITGLPQSNEPCKNPVFAFHIHSGSLCKGNADDPFSDAGTHYNPSGCPHPYHAGDLSPLFGANGKAFSAFLTDRFTVREIIGKTVIIHSRPDDFKTQPSGNAGEKIACGEIRSVKR